jgi:hypothetical protein
MLVHPAPLGCCIDRSFDPGLDVHLVLDNYGTHKHPKRIHRGSFRSVCDLIKAIHDYILLYNNKARPFQGVASASRIIRKANK